MTRTEPESFTRLLVSALTPCTLKLHMQVQRIRYVIHFQTRQISQRKSVVLLPPTIPVIPITTETATHGVSHRM